MFFSSPNTLKKTPVHINFCNRFMFANFRCVEHHLCNGDGEIITDGGDIFSFRNPFNVGNSKCPGFTEVCCRKEEFRDIPIGGTVTVKAPSKKCKECHNDGYVGIKI